MLLDYLKKAFSHWSCPAKSLPWWDFQNFLLFQDYPVVRSCVSQKAHVKFNSVIFIYKALFHYNGQHASLKNARHMESVSQTKLLYFEGIFKF